MTEILLSPSIAQARPMRRRLDVIPAALSVALAVAGALLPGVMRCAGWLVAISAAAVVVWYGGAALALVIEQLGTLASMVVDGALRWLTAPAQLPMVLLGRAFSGFDAVQSRSSRGSSGPQYAQVADEAVTLLCDRIADPAGAPRTLTLAREA